MNTLQNKIPISFSKEDLDHFSVASHDRNPLHLSEIYARKTPYGNRVVFGVLGGLSCLQHLKERSGFLLSRIVFEFQNPMFIGIKYDLEVQDDAPEQAVVKIQDGRDTLLRAMLYFRKGKIESLGRNTPFSRLTEPASFVSSDLVQNLSVEGEYFPSLEAFRSLVTGWNLASRGVSDLHIATLMWCSYLVGMELPGCRALFSSLSLDFAEVENNSAGSRLSYAAKVVSFDKRFDLLKVKAHLSYGQTPWANAELRSFVRQDSPVISSTPLQFPHSEAFKGKVALIVGASRGLGAAIAQVLILQGCSVLLNFLKSKDEAEKLKQSLSHQNGKVALLQGDAKELKSCQEMKHKILEEYGKIDFLICNACPPLLPLWIESAKVTRINEYMSTSLALVSVPLAVFMEILPQRHGWVVVISSAAVKTLPAEWPHYVSAKCAIEGLVRVAAIEYGAINFVLVRPSKLLTDLTNTPMGRQDAIATERVAVKIAERLAGEGQIGKVEVLDTF